MEPVESPFTECVFYWGLHYDSHLTRVAHRYEIEGHFCKMKSFRGANGLPFEVKPKFQMFWFVGMREEFQDMWIQPNDKTKSLFFYPNRRTMVETGEILIGETLSRSYSLNEEEKHNLKIVLKSLYSNRNLYSV